MVITKNKTVDYIKKMLENSASRLDKPNHS